MPEILVQYRAKLGHAWRVQSEGAALRTRCTRCNMLFSQWWESHNRAACLPLDDVLDDTKCGAD